MNTALPQNANGQAKPLAGLKFKYNSVINRYQPPHTHDTYQIVIVYNGVSEFFVRGNRYSISGDNLIIIPPGERHSGHLIGDEGRLMRQFLYIEPEIMRSMVAMVAGQGQASPDFSVLDVSNTHLVSALQQFYPRLSQAETLLTQETVLLQTLTSLVRLASDNPPGERTMHQEHYAVQRLRNYLEENFAENISLDDLARLAHFDKYYLLKTFQHHVGVTPHQYHILARIERAKTLLRRGETPAYAASAVGFSDQSHLTRVFKRYLHITPGWYQRTAR